MTSLSLLQVIKNPVTDHLPTGCQKIGTSFHADQCVDVKQFATENPVVFVVGAMAHGKVPHMHPHAQLQPVGEALWGSVCTGGGGLHTSGSSY